MKIVYFTAAKENGREIASILVDEKLVACCNILDCNSIYWWDGKLTEDEEVVVLAKTCEENVEKVINRVSEIHSYDVPCVLVLSPEEVLGKSEEYLKKTLGRSDGTTG